MMFHVITLSRNEIYKVLRSKLTWFFLACGVGIILFWGISADYFYSDNAQPGTSYNFVLSSNQTAMSFLGSIVILIFGSLLISSEAASRTLQMNLVNPISRLEYLIAKLASGWFFSFLFIVSMALPALAIGGLKFGYGDLTEGGVTLFSRGQIFLAIVFCYLILFVILLAYISYSLLISVLTSNAGYAIGFSVGSVLFLDLIRVRLGISPYLFQSYIETPFELVKSMTEGLNIIWKPDIYLCLGVPLVWSVGSFISAFLVMSRKDYKS